MDEFTEVGGMSNGDDITMVKVSGDRMFNGRIISDISDPLAPTIIGTVQVEDIRDYEIDGSFYHVITNDGYIVFDITDPANPELRADFDHTGQDIELVGDYAYISSIPYFDNEQGGLEILDVSNLDEIRVVNSLSYEEMERTTGYMISHEDYLYSLSLYSFGIFDISDAESPSLVGTNSDIYSPYGFELYENYVYILGEKRFYILDISEPDNPILVSDTLELSSWKMTVEGDYLFLSGAGWDHGNFRSYAQGVQILSLETPTVPNIAGYYQTFREASMSAVKDGICYVADVNSVLILDYAEALTALCWDKQNILPNYKLYSAFPNPFNAQTQISYDLPTSANVKLSIFDIKGRTVDVLEQGMRTLGQHRLIWNGSRFVSGTYFVRLDAGGVVNNQSVVLIK